MSFTAKSSEVRRLDISPSDRIIVTYTPLVLRREITPQDPAFKRGIAKPRGLWYSCGRSWIRWTEAAEACTDWNYVYRLHLWYLALPTLLQISSRAQFEAFDQTFTRTLHGGPSIHYPDWLHVAEHYTGVEICPYRKEYPPPIWYYTWDVASGCIWDTNIVQEVEQLL